MNPVVTKLHLVNHTGTPDDLVTSDVRVAGTMTIPDGSVNLLQVPYKFTGDSIEHDTAETARERRSDGA